VLKKKLYWMFIAHAKFILFFQIIRILTLIHNKKLWYKELYVMLSSSGYNMWCKVGEWLAICILDCIQHHGTSMFIKMFIKITKIKTIIIYLLGEDSKFLNYLLSYLVHVIENHNKMLIKIFFNLLNCEISACV